MSDAQRFLAAYNQSEHLRKLNEQLKNDPPFKCRICGHEHARRCGGHWNGVFGSGYAITDQQWCCRGCTVVFDEVKAFSVLEDRDQWLRDNGYGVLLDALN